MFAFNNECKTLQCHSRRQTCAENSDKIAFISIKYFTYNKLNLNIFKYIKTGKKFEIFTSFLWIRRRQSMNFEPDLNVLQILNFEPDENGMNSNPMKKNLPIYVQDFFPRKKLNEPLTLVAT